MNKQQVTVSALAMAMAVTTLLTLGPAGLAVAGTPPSASIVPPPRTQGPAPVIADQLILQFKQPALQAALRQAPQAPAARASVQRALDALGQRHRVTLQYVQSLAVGSALVAVTPATAQIDALVKRMAGDAEVAAVEINARMTPFTPPAR